MGAETRQGPAPGGAGSLRPEAGQARPQGRTPRGEDLAALRPRRPRAIPHRTLLRRAQDGRACLQGIPARAAPLSEAAELRRGPPSPAGHRDPLPRRAMVQALGLHPVLPVDGQDRGPLRAGRQERPLQRDRPEGVDERRCRPRETEELPARRQSLRARRRPLSRPSRGRGRRPQQGRFRLGQAGQARHGPPGDPPSPQATRPKTS